MSTLAFVGLLEGNASFKNTGTLTLPSLDDIKDAPTELKERLTKHLKTTTSIKLGHEDYPNLQGS